MPRFKFYLEYQGTRYSGWQIQQNARTVQGEISSAIKKVTRQTEFEFYGAGRTDAGVHALRQIAHLDIRSASPPDNFRRELNDELPSDINILKIEPAHERFHARHGAVSRSYLYQISRRRTAFGKKLVWWVKEELDIQQMQRAAALFSGMRDYRSFAAEETPDRSTRVLIERIELREYGDLLLIRIQGSHFLWKMVRRIVGVLVEVGRGGLTIEDVGHFLKSKSDKPARLAAPASGLFLERVFYKGDPRGMPLHPVISLG
jgi:tRNA pseudouridine38-40 synthase